MTTRHGGTTRRAVLAGGLGLLVPAVLPGGAGGAVPDAGRLDFRAFRDGDPFGWHRLRFSSEGGQLEVEIEIRFEVTFGFLTFYRYRHTSRETWRGDRLARLETRTDDDGETYRVSARAEGERLIVDGNAGRLELPGDTLPTSYWHEATVEREAWLDTQTGRLVRSSVTAEGIERIEAGGREVPARRYRLDGDLDALLWYHEGHWVKLRFEARGSTIDYVRQARDGAGA